MVIVLIAIVLVLPACSSKPKLTQDGYAILVNLQGNSNMESKVFSITDSDNRLSIATSENNKDGIKGAIVIADGSVQDGAVVNSFSVGETPTKDKWPFNLKPGKYKLKVESTGTKFELSMEEKVSKK